MDEEVREERKGTQMTLTIYLKNLAGDLLPLSADPSWGETELLAHLTALDPGNYPPKRTQILRPPGPLEAEEVIVVWVEAGPYVERWESEGKQHVRYVVPFPHGVLHVRRILLFHTWVRFYAKHVSHERDEPEIVQPCATLYEAIRAVWPEVTPGDMQTIYSVILPDLEKEAVRKGMIYCYEYFQEEPMECACGLIVPRSALSSQERTERRCPHETDKIESPIMDGKGSSTTH